MVETASNQIEIAQTSSFGDAVGQISTVKGGVFITHTDGSREPAQSGSPIYQGDQVETAAKGSVGIIFSDDSTFSLADEGSMVIDEMIYDPSSQQGSSVLNVAQGVFTFASGLIAKTDVDAMTITTPTATIGIRGTSGGGKAAPEGQPNTLSLFADADGNVGEMTVSNSVGSQVLSAPNQTTQITSSFSPPSKPVVMPPSVIQQFYSAARDALPPSPTPQEDQGATGDQTAEEGANAEGGTEADAEALAEAEAQAQAEGTQDPEGEPLLEGGIDPEAEAAALAAAEAAKQLAGGLGEEADAAIEGAATEAAQAAMEDALGQGLSPQEAGQQAQAAALAAATAEARNAGISEAEINAGAGAFEQALAGGASLEDAFAAAMDAGGSAGEQAAVQFDTAVAQIQQQFGFGGPGPGGPVGPGLGGPGGPGPDGGSAGGQGSGPGGSGPGGFGPGVFGPNFGPAEFGNFGPAEFGEFGPAEFGEFADFFVETFQDFGPQEIDGVLTFQDNDNNSTPPIGAFDETIASFSTGSETLSGKEGSEGTTRFVMANSVLGGNDTINGFGGTDEIAFTELVNFSGSYDAGAAGTLADPDIKYSGGQLILNGIEQLYFGEAGGSKVRLGTDGDTSGVGFVLVGGTGDDTSLSTATGATVGGRVVGSTASSVLGSLVFGGAGNDTLTGSIGDDIFYGGTGNDTMEANEGDNNLDGGAGNDTFNVSKADSSNTIDGGNGTDTVSYASQTAVQTYTFTASSLGVTRPNIGSNQRGDTLTSIETLTGSNQADTYKLIGGIPTGFTAITAGSAIDNFNITGTITAALDGGAGNDVLTFTTLGGTLSSIKNFYKIEGNTGTDNVTLAAGGNTISEIKGTIEQLTGGSGTDSITLSSSGATLGIVSSIETIIGGTGTDSISLADGGQTVTSVSGTIETFTGGTGGTDSITLAGTNVTLGNVSKIETIVGGAGTDTVTLAAGGVTVSNISLVETINGGAGADTITMSGATAATVTGNGGNDTITGGSGADTFKWAATTDGIDQITLFASNDKYNYTQLNIDGDGVGNTTALTLGTTYLEYGTHGATANYNNADVIVFNDGATYANAQTAFSTLQGLVGGGGGTQVANGGAVLFLWDSSAGTDDVTLSIVYDSGSDGFGTGDFTDTMVLNDSGDSTLTIADVAAGVDNSNFFI